MPKDSQPNVSGKRLDALRVVLSALSLKTTPVEDYINSDMETAPSGLLFPSPSEGPSSRMDPVSQNGKDNGARESAVFEVVPVLGSVAITDDPCGGVTEANKSVAERASVFATVARALGHPEGCLAGSGETEAAYWHDYIHGLGTIVANTEGVREVLWGGGAGPGNVQGGGPSVPVDHGRLREMVDAIAFVAECERHHALTVLAHLMPSFLPGIDKPEIIRKSPLEVIRELMAGYQRMAERRRIEIVVEDAEEVQPPEIWLERSGFGRLCHNLLSNAIKYSYSGFIDEAGTAHTRKIKVWFTPRHDQWGNRTVLHIQNYGVGILPDEMAMVKRAGFRGKMARAEARLGTGLGLTEVDRIAGLHGGHLFMESKPIAGGAYLTTANVVLSTRARPQREG